MIKDWCNTHTGDSDSTKVRLLSALAAALAVAASVVHAGAQGIAERPSFMVSGGVQWHLEPLGTWLITRGDDEPQPLGFREPKSGPGLGVGLVVPAAHPVLAARVHLWLRPTYVTNALNINGPSLLFSYATLEISLQGRGTLEPFYAGLGVGARARFITDTNALDRRHHRRWLGNGVQPLSSVFAGVRTQRGAWQLGLEGGWYASRFRARSATPEQPGAAQNDVLVRVVAVRRSRR